MTDQLAPQDSALLKTQQHDVGKVAEAFNVPSAGLRVGPLPAETDWLRVPAAGASRVDRENNVILGYVVAQEGPFKTPGRGEFDKEALRTIRDLMNTKPAGLKSRFTHPSLSGDGLGTFLGRSKGARLETGRNAAGKEVLQVRADLHLDPTSFDTPNGNLGKYVMDLAESDPDALSSSLVLQREEELRIDEKGRRLKDAEGEDLPPLWRPTRLHASDIVDTGDACDGLLSAEGLPDAVVRQGAAMLDRQFADQPRDVVEARCRAWLDRYLELRYGASAPEAPATPSAEPEAAADEALRLDIELRARELDLPPADKSK